MKKNIYLVFTCMVILLSGCSERNISESSISERGPVSSAPEESEVSASTSEKEPVSSAVEGSPLGGGPVTNTRYWITFFNIDIRLVDHVGIDATDQWSEDVPIDEQSVYHFIKYFNISEEEVTRLIYDPRFDPEVHEVICSMEQIEAICSGDWREINRQFYNPYTAYYSEQSGEIYDFVWMLEHTPEEIAAAGIPESEMDRISALLEEGIVGIYNSAELHEQLEEKLTEYRAEKGRLEAN